MCWAKLVAHWPRLGGSESDPLATARAHDWIRSLTHLDARRGLTAVEQVIASHRELRLPVFADVQEAAQQIARREALEEPRVLSAGTGRRLSREELAQVLAPAREKLAGAAHNQKVRDARR